MDSTFQLAIIVPCFQEQDRLPATFEKLNSAYASGLLDRTEVAIVLVNDGSTDSTAELLNAFAEDRPHVFVVHVKENQGKGGAIKAGIQAVDAAHYGYTDADLAYGLSEIPTVLRQLREAPVVIGVREKHSLEQSYPHMRRFVSQTLQLITRFVTGIQVQDTQCGFKFFSADVAQRIVPQVEQDRFSFDVAFLALLTQQRVPIQTMPMTFVHDEQSSVRMHDGVRYVLDLFGVYDTLRARTGRYMALLGFLAAALTALLFFWIVSLGQFFSDDFTWLWYGTQIAADPFSVVSLRASSFFSPVMNAFYAVFFGVFHLTAGGLLFIGLCVHAINAFLAGVLAYNMLQSRLTGVFTTVLVVVAGSAYEPLVWMSANMHSVVSLFILLSLLGYWLYLSRRKALPLLFSFLFLLCAFGTKELAITLPFLLLFVMLYRRAQQKDVTFSPAHKAFWAAVSMVTAGYLSMQVWLQLSGDAVASGAYGPRLTQVLRFSFVVLDLFVPLQAVDHLISLPLAVVLFSVLMVSMTLLLVRSLRQRGIVAFCLMAIAVSVLPTILFHTNTFWEPLASRYTYLPHLFSSLLVAASLAYLIQKNKSRYVIHVSALALLVVSVLQFGYMRSVTLNHYAYVYRTGFTLQHAATLIARDKPDVIYVHPEHPFRNNTAHIRGALQVFGDLGQDQVVFLETDQVVETDSAHMLLYWNPDVPQYELTSKADLLYDYPWETQLR